MGDGIKLFSFFSEGLEKDKCLLDIRRRQSLSLFFESLANKPNLIPIF